MSASEQRLERPLVEERLLGADDGAQRAVLVRIEVVASLTVRVALRNHERLFGYHRRAKGSDEVEEFPVAAFGDSRVDEGRLLLEAQAQRRQI
jgi:hypothetical protein